MKTWGIYAWEFGVRHEIAEFKNKEDAERALKYLRENFGGKYEVIQERVFESFEEFVKIIKEEADER